MQSSARKKGQYQITFSRCSPHIHTYHRKMLNVGASSPLNLHRKVLQAKLNPSASNSSRSVIAHPLFYSSNKSVTSDDRGATHFEGDNDNHFHPIPQNPSLLSFQTEESPSRDGHDDHDRDPPTVLNIRLASGGVYDLERTGRFGHQSYVSVVSDSDEGHSRSSAPSHKVCNRTFQLDDPLSNLLQASVSNSRSPSLSGIRHEAIVRQPAVITRSWKD